MNMEIVRLTARQVLGRRRSILMVLGAMFPILVATIFACSRSS